MSLNHICALILVDDMKKSRYFYEQILEQDIRLDHGENLDFGTFSLHLKSHYCCLLNITEDKVIRHAHNMELYFETDEMDAVLARLTAEQVQFVHGIREQPWGQRVLRCYDPDGYIIEIGERMESVVSRFYATGLTIEQVSERCSLPIEFVSSVVSAK